MVLYRGDPDPEIPLLDGCSLRRDRSPDAELVLDNCLLWAVLVRDSDDPDVLRDPIDDSLLRNLSLSELCFVLGDRLLLDDEVLCELFFLDEADLRVEVDLLLLLSLILVVTPSNSSPP